MSAYKRAHTQVRTYNSLSYFYERNLALIVERHAVSSILSPPLFHATAPRLCGLHRPGPEPAGR